VLAVAESTGAPVRRGKGGHARAAAGNRRLDSVPGKSMSAKRTRQRIARYEIDQGFDDLKAGRRIRSVTVFGDAR
jgi:hypothetical protein